jgi:hypothetical protein
MRNSTLLKRADALKKLRDNGPNVGNNFIQRVQRLYPESRLCWNPNRNYNPFRPKLRKSFRLPNERIFSLFELMSHTRSFENRHYRKAAKLLRDLQPTDEEFKRDFDGELFWKDKLARMRDISEDSGGRDKNIEDMKFILEWLVDDINPEWLPSEDRNKMNALKSSMLHGADDSHTMTIERFMKEMDNLEQDKKQFSRLMGPGKKGKENWAEVKPLLESYAEALARTRPYRLTESKMETLKQENRNNNFGGPNIKYR